MEQRQVVRTLALTALLFIAACSDEGGTGCVPVLSGWRTPESGQPHYTVKNTVSLRGRDILWDGVPVDEETLADYLRRGAGALPVPFVVFDPGAEDCAFATRVQAVIDQNYPCGNGACGRGLAESYP
jgi:hypothetical protein